MVTSRLWTRFTLYSSEPGERVPAGDNLVAWKGDLRRLPVDCPGNRLPRSIAAHGLPLLGGCEVPGTVPSSKVGSGEMCVRTGTSRGRVMAHCGGYK